MAIQGKVSAVNGQVAVDGGLYLHVAGAGQWDGDVPVEAMVANDEVHSCQNCCFERQLPLVDSGRDFSYSAVVFELKTVVGAIEMLDFFLMGMLITKSDEFGK